MKTKQCKTCKETKLITEFQSSGWYTRKDGTKGQSHKSECKPCFNKANMKKYHQKFDSLGIEWKCVMCGYDKCKAALDFHHLDPTQKDFSIRGTQTRKGSDIEKLKLEIAKCILVCSNCHREIHDDIRQIHKEFELDEKEYRVVLIE